MASSPRSVWPVKPAARAGLEALEPEAYKAKLTEVADEYLKLIRLAVAFGKTPKDKKFNIPVPVEGGATTTQTIDSKVIASMRSALRAELEKLGKMYSKVFARAKKARKATAARPNAGFRIPRFVDQNIVNFFRNANLGPAYVINEVSYNEKNKPIPHFRQEADRLQTVLPLLINEGLTTQALMTPLFAIYAQLAQARNADGSMRQGLQIEGARQYLQANPEMDQYFAGVYQQIAAAEDAEITRLANSDKQKDRDRVVQAQDESGQVRWYMKSKKGAIIPRFSPQAFRYASFQSFVKFSSVPKDGNGKYAPDLQARLDQVLAAQDTAQRAGQDGPLDKEWRYASHSRAFQRWSPEELARRKASRQAQALRRKQEKAALKAAGAQ